MYVSSEFYHVFLIEYPAVYTFMYVVYNNAIFCLHFSFYIFNSSVSGEGNIEFLSENFFHINIARL